MPVKLWMHDGSCERNVRVTKRTVPLETICALSQRFYVKISRTSRVSWCHAQAQKPPSQTKRTKACCNPCRVLVLPRRKLSSVKPRLSVAVDAVSRRSNRRLNLRFYRGKCTSGFKRQCKSAIASITRRMNAMNI